MPTSENGWPVIPPSSLTLLTDVVHVGGRALRFRSGPVAAVMAAFLARFVAEVEPLAGGGLDDWSYAYRPVRGGSEWSNHSSATAVDCNAERHPLGQVGTYSPAAHHALLQLLDDFPVIRWGGEYSGRKDEMHFEIRPGTSAADLAAFLHDLEANMPLNAGDLDQIRSVVRGEVERLTSLTVKTGYQPDGTYSEDPAKRQTLTLGQLLTETRGRVLQLLNRP